MTVQRALVIGGGIAGPVVATALTRENIEAEVFEAYPESSEGIGGSLALAPNGVAALDLIGAGDAVRQRALPITRSFMTIADRYVADAPRMPGAEPLRMIDRGPLHTALRERALAAGVSIRYRKRLVGVEERSDGVTARFDDGSTAEGDVLIGADGVRSTVRRLIDPAAPGPDYTGMLGFEGVAPDLTVEAEPGEMVFAFGRRAYYLYWPLPGGGVGWGANLPSKAYLSLTEARRTPGAEWLATLRATYADDAPGSALLAGTSLDTFRVTGALHIMPPVPHWSRGRLVLVGDAVHAPSNSTGQGASLAIESAIVLARCLAHDGDPSSAFAAYGALRRGRVEKITRRGAQLNRAKTPGPVGRAMMRVIMPLVLRSAGSAKALAYEQGFRLDALEGLGSMMGPCA